LLLLFNNVLHQFFERHDNSKAAAAMF
jgi:hypothetical protein